MTSTYSPALRLELMATGDQSGTWGDTTNTNLGTLLEQAITGVLSVAQGDVANLTLTSLNGASDQARNAVVNVTGAMTADRNVVVPTSNKLYLVKNSTTGGYAVTVKTVAGTGVSIAASSSQWVYCDGTNVVQGLITNGGTLAIADGGTGATTASGARTNLGLGTAAVLDTATTAQYLSNTASKVLTTDQVNAAGALFALTDASTVAWNMASGFNASLLIGGNRTLGNPTNPIVGRTGALVVTQSGGSRTLAYDTNWEAAGGSFPVLSTANGAKDILFYWIQSSTSIIITGILNAVA